MRFPVGQNENQHQESKRKLFRRMSFSCSILYVFPANERATANAEDVSNSVPASHHDAMLHLSNSHIDTNDIQK